MTTELLHGAQRTGRRDDAAIRRWRGHRLGQFIHFGLYSLPAGTWAGETVDFAAEFLPSTAKVPPQEWARLADDFRLEGFDAERWADHAVAAGAGYVTITTKHHEGFCLWPSRLTRFTIAQTPYGRDLLGELVAAYDRRGIDVHLYYSVLDWHHPDWRYREESPEDAQAGERYRAFALGQLEELAHRYPSVKGFWFDGTWDDSVRLHGAWTHQVEDALKAAIPGVLVNSRLRADELGNRHFDANGAMMGDFESGYERRLPEPWNTEVLQRDWEACLTIPQHTWGHHAGEWARASRKDWRDLVDHLAHTVSRGGNLLLNVGPRGDGSFDPDDLAVTARVGDWVERHAAAIRGADAEPRLEPPGWGYYTHGADGRSHAVITRTPTSRRVRLEAPAGLRLDDVRIEVAAEVVRLTDGLVELRLAAVPQEPIVASFSLGEAAPRRRAEVNPDVVD